MNFGLIGYSGRLGTEVQDLFEENNHTCVYKYGINVEEHLANPDVMIDCSLPEVFDKTVEMVRFFQSPLIIGTTGLTEDNFKTLYALSEMVPVVQSFNFSVGIQVLLHLTKEAKNIVGADWDIEISETHHRFKKDKPSGTALMIKDAVEKEDVNMSSLRLGNVSGDHTISFGGLGEILSINHRALSRRTFAEGILRSAEFVKNAAPGFYTFTDILFNNSSNSLGWK